MKKSYVKKIIISSIVLVVIIALSVYFYIQKQRGFSDTTFLPEKDAVISNIQSTPAPSTMPTTLPSTEFPNGLTEYRNSYYKFTLEYPSELSVSEFAENGGGRTIVFQNNATSTLEGFQIYITPYAYTQITKEQFLKDEPSGVFNQPTNIVIDGLRATMFYSKNSVMGDTREVWFITDGSLYEVITYKDQDEWLSKIMSTWKFIQ